MPFRHLSVDLTHQQFIGTHRDLEVATVVVTSQTIITQTD